MVIFTFLPEKNTTFGRFNYEYYVTKLACAFLHIQRHFFQPFLSHPTTVRWWSEFWWATLRISSWQIKIRPENRNHKTTGIKTMRQCPRRLFFCIFSRLSSNVFRVSFSFSLIHVILVLFIVIAVLDQKRKLDTFFLFPVVTSSLLFPRLPLLVTPDIRTLWVSYQNEKVKKFPFWKCFFGGWNTKIVCIINLFLWGFYKILSQTSQCFL